MNKILYILPILLTACNHTPNYCNSYNCKMSRGESYTISKPVEVIYKNTTYTTVYEPKTYEEVSYERKPYKGNSCYEKGRTFCR